MQIHNFVVINKSVSECKYPYIKRIYTQDCVYRLVTNKAKKKDSDNENDRENGLRMKNEMTMKEKRFSFFAYPQEGKAESQLTFGTLPFARHTSQRFAKVKEPNLAQPTI